jgi:uncharacterized membrane protein YvbJ
MKCPKCQSENPEDSKFCLECGKKMELESPSCGKSLPINAKFCNECGHNLTLPSKPTPKDLSLDEKIDKIQESGIEVLLERKIEQIESDGFLVSDQEGKQERVEGEEVA